MFEGIYFEFPKLSFLLFVFLACENLCPLRIPMLYFPHLERFTGVGVKSPAWMWISKWLMISFLIVAMMSPVRDIPQTPHFEGFSTLIVVDRVDDEVRNKIQSFIQLRPHDKIALYLPENIKIPLTTDHNALLAIVDQLPETPISSSVDYTIKRFVTSEKYPWIVIFSPRPKAFIHSLPPQIERSIVPQKGWEKWMASEDENHKPLLIRLPPPEIEYFYFIPLFLAFLAMLVYLYGRNQKGVV